MTNDRTQYNWFVNIVITMSYEIKTMHIVCAYSIQGIPAKCAGSPNSGCVYIKIDVVTILSRLFYGAVKY